MTTNQPVELGKVSEETKQPGFSMPDNIHVPTGEPLA
jgi:hypothetical protein